MKKIALVALVLLLVSAVSGERTGESFIQPFNLMALEVSGVCAGASQSNQCAEYVLGTDTLPPYVGAVLEAEGVIIGDCGNIVVLSSGDPADGDTSLSTNMGNAGCGTNPDGYQTYDCVDLASFNPTADSVVLAYSSEYPEWLASSFTDWMRIMGGAVSVDISIDDWVNVNSIPYDPSDTGTQTLAQIYPGTSYDLRIADSGDGVLDTGMIIVPLSCFEDDPEALLFCGDNDVNLPNEECDGTDDSECPGECNLECLCGGDGGPGPEPTIPEFTAIGAGIALLGAVVFLTFRKR